MVRARSAGRGFSWSCRTWELVPCVAKDWRAACARRYSDAAMEKWRPARTRNSRSLADRICLRDTVQAQIEAQDGHHARR